MSTFNKKSMKNKENVLKHNIVLNHEGEEVYALSPLKGLLQRVLGSNFGQDGYYEKADPSKEFKELIQMIQSIPEEDKEYALKIAELGRYSGAIEYPLNALTVCYNLDRYKGDKFLDANGVSNLGYYSDVLVRRAKDINHILATQFSIYGKNIPKQMSKNLKGKLEFFDKYKLSKGLDRGKAVSLADSIKLLHPTPKNIEMADFYKSIIENNVIVGNDKVQLQAEITKVKLQEKASKEEKPEIDLEKLIEAMYKSNLVALLKNINMLLQYDIFDTQEHLDYVVDKITDLDTIVASKVLPYQFYALYKVLNSRSSTKPVTAIKNALSKAVELSIVNVEDIKGYTAFLIDLSSSMNTPVGTNSSISCMEMAALLGAIAFKKGNGDLFVFSDDCKKVNANKGDSVFTIVDIIIKSIPHYCTYLDRAFDMISSFAKKNHIKYDNLLLLSDGDCYSYDNKKKTLKIGDYETSLNNKCSTLMKNNVIDTIWINDLSGNKYTVVNTDECKKNLIAGYSEKFIDMINLYYNIRNNEDIKPLIDALLEQYKSKK